MTFSQRSRKIFLWLAGLISLCFAGVAYFIYVVPDLIVKEIESRYPVHIRGDVHLEWPILIITDVDAQVGGWLTAHIDRVQVTRDRHVTLHGGEAVLDLGLKPKTDKTTIPKTAASSFSKIKHALLDKVTVKHRKGYVTLRDVERGDAGSVCFRSGQARIHPPNLTELELTQGCINEDHSKVNLEEVAVRVFVPEGWLPEVYGAQDIKARDVVVDLITEYIHAGDVVINEELLARTEARTFDGQLPLQLIQTQVSYQDGLLLLDAASLTTTHRWLSTRKSTFSTVKLTVPIQSDEVNIQVSLGGSTLRVNPERYSAEGDEPCSDWAASIPTPKFDALQPKHFTGSFSFTVQATPTPKVEIKHTCKYSCSESPIKELKKVFEYEAYDKAGDLFIRESGPGSSGWVPFKRLPEHIGKAFVSLEDPSFRRNRGILTASLKVALEQNLEKGYFFRGGSTITQQLAKNLWLRRDKTIGRKVEEAFLTIALESCLTKDQILELYLNVVEYGPDLYGLRNATMHYFGKEPDYLTLEEAYYLASLMPNPKAATLPSEGGLKRARRLMAILQKHGRLPEEMEIPTATSFDGWELAE